MNTSTSSNDPRSHPPRSRTPRRTTRERYAALARGFFLLIRGTISQPLWFWTAFIGGASFALLQIATADLMGWVTDSVVAPAYADPSRTLHLIVVGAAALLGVGGARALTVVIRRTTTAFLGYSLELKTRRALINKLVQLPLMWHRRMGAGSVLTRVINDADYMWQAIGALPFAASTILMLVIGFLAVMQIDPWLGMVTGFLLPALVMINLLYERFLTPYVIQAQHCRSRVTGVAHESLSGAQLVKVFGREELETDRLRLAAQDLARANTRAATVRAIFDPLIDALPNIGTVCLIVVGAIRAQSGHVTVGDIVTVSYLLTIMNVPIRSIGFVLSSLPNTVVCAGRVDEILQASTDMEYGQLQPDQASRRCEGCLSRIDFDHVGFEYPDAPDEISASGGSASQTTRAHRRSAALSDLSLRAGGEDGARVVALVGRTGSGKSTAALLAARLMDPIRGQIRLDGTALPEFEQESLAREDLVLVLQHAFVFDRSVRDNVLMGLEASDDDVWRALKIACAEDFCRHLPEGLDTVLGERGSRLSGGQRQRIALARALVRQPRVLVIDDATSAVDPVVEENIIASLRRHIDRATVVMVAYRKSAITLADEVVVVDQGRVVAHGAPEELARTCPEYIELVNAYDVAAAQARAEAGMTSEEGIR